MTPSPRLALCLCTLAAAAAPLRGQDDTLAVRDARAHARALLDTIPAPGLSVAVSVDGRLVWAEGFGMADHEAGVPADEHTAFGVGSVSKPLVAAALARLWERGEVDIDAPAARYVAGLPASREGVTLRRLAGHLAGIRHYRLADLAPPPAPRTTTLERVAGFAADPLVAEPGTRHVYSSWGYVLLAAAMEGATGRDLLALVAQEVTQPLGLEATSADGAGEQAVNRAAQYTGCGSTGCTRAPPADHAGMWAAGGFVSTSADLARFGAALMGPGYLRPETVAALWTPQRTVAGEDTGYGIGWRVGRDAAGRRIAHHGGRMRHLRAFLLLYPDQGVAVAVLANGPADFAEDEAARIAAPFLPR